MVSNSIECVTVVCQQGITLITTSNVNAKVRESAIALTQGPAPKKQASRLVKLLVLVGKLDRCPVATHPPYCNLCLVFIHDELKEHGNVIMLSKASSVEPSCINTWKM